MSERIRRNPKLFSLAIGLLAGAAVWAVLPRDAEAAQPSTKDLILMLQEEMLMVGHQVEQIPPNWLPSEERQRFELVLPQQGPSGTVYEGVLDRRTGLIWQRRPANELYSVDSAQFLALSSRDGGVMGWRLPFADELLTIAEVEAGVFVGLSDDFPLARDSTIGKYWTQSVIENSGFSYRVIVDFQIAYVGSTLSLGQSAQLWLVMGPGGAHR